MADLRRRLRGGGRESGAGRLECLLLEIDLQGHDSEFRFEVLASHRLGVGGNRSPSLANDGDQCVSPSPCPRGLYWLALADRDRFIRGVRCIRLEDTGPVGIVSRVRSVVSGLQRAIEVFIGGDDPRQPRVIIRIARVRGFRSFSASRRRKRERDRDGKPGYTFARTSRTISTSRTSSFASIATNLSA